MVSPMQSVDIGARRRLTLTDLAVTTEQKKPTIQTSSRRKPNIGRPGPIFNRPGSISNAPKCGRRSKAGTNLSAQLGDHASDSGSRSDASTQE